VPSDLRNVLEDGFPSIGSSASRLSSYPSQRFGNPGRRLVPPVPGSYNTAVSDPETAAVSRPEVLAGTIIDPHRGLGDDTFLRFCRPITSRSDPSDLFYSHELKSEEAVAPSELMTHPFFLCDNEVSPLGPPRGWYRIFISKADHFLLTTLDILIFVSSSGPPRKCTSWSSLRSFRRRIL